MLQDKEIKKIQEIKTDFTPTGVSTESIFNRFKALKISEGFSEFKQFKARGYGLKMILSVLVSMVVSPDKTVSSYLNSLTGEGSEMGKDVFLLMDSLEDVTVVYFAAFPEGDLC